MKKPINDPYIVKCASCNKDVSIKDVIDAVRQPWKRIPDSMFIAKYYCENCQKNLSKEESC